MNKNVAETLSKKTSELYLEKLDHEKQKVKIDIEQQGNKVLKNLGEGLQILNEVKTRIEPFCGLVEIDKECQQIDSMLYDIDSDSTYLLNRLSLVKATFY